MLAALLFKSLAVLVSLTASQASPLHWSDSNGKAAPNLKRNNKNDHSVLILGGGMAGVIAARELHKAGIHDFLLIEGRDELGGRMQSHVLPNNITIELANWIEGISSPEGKTNPIYTLAQKHGLKLVDNDWDNLTYYDQNGIANYTDQCDAAYEKYLDMIAGAGERIAKRKVDLTARSGYHLTGDRAVMDQYDKACEYFNFQWEWAQDPEQSSWLAVSNAYNSTFDTVEGFGDADLMCQDQRGFKTIVQQEAAEFLKSEQLVLSSVVTEVNYTDSGVTVGIDGGKTYSADHVLITFANGVLQTDDVAFDPPLPDWKREAIQTMKQATYTKIFFIFPSKFWSDTEMDLYADPYKQGYYPVWQSLDHAGFFPGSHMYFVTIVGDESERVENLSDEMITAEGMAVLRSMYPDRTVPEPTSIYLKRWHMDPLFRGSWANWPAGFYTEHMWNLRASVEQRLHFAGEGTSLEYYGYLHGAYYEGENRGWKIGKCLNGDCSEILGGSDFTADNAIFPTHFDLGSKRH